MTSRTIAVVSTVGLQTTRLTGSGEQPIDIWP
jgi:hypothetical protein